jgi:hypothetical protein
MEASSGLPSTIEPAFGETFGLAAYGVGAGMLQSKVETIAVQEQGRWLVITVVAKYF